MAFDIPSHTADATLAAIGSKSTYAGVGTLSVGWFLSSEFGVLTGLVLGISGWLMNFYYSRKRDKREQAEHELRMATRKEPQ